MGSIDSRILLDIVKTLDILNVFKTEREHALKPISHGSWFDLKFLEYINAPETEWCVCIGVPYGTSLWQVGDSSQQNG